MKPHHHLLSLTVIALTLLASLSRATPSAPPSGAAAAGRGLSLRQPEPRMDTTLQVAQQGSGDLPSRRPPGVTQWFGQTPSPGPPGVPQPGAPAAEQARPPEGTENPRQELREDQVENPSEPQVPLAEP